MKVPLKICGEASIDRDTLAHGIITKVFMHKFLVLSSSHVLNMQDNLVGILSPMCHGLWKLLHKSLVALSIPCGIYMALDSTVLVVTQSKASLFSFN